MLSVDVLRAQRNGETHTTVPVTLRYTLWNCWSIPKSQIFQWRSMLNNFIDVEKSYSVRFDSEYLLLYTHQPPVKAQMPAVQCRIALG